MRVVGLTGGIGTGKSTVSRMLRELGVTVIDADAAARAVVEPGTEGFRQVVEAFGRDVVGPDGRLDRPRLAAVVFGDATARDRLNQIVHPLVRERMLSETAAAGERGEAYVVHDIPLLYEGRDPSGFWKVVVVYVPPALQLERLLAREQDGRHLTEAEARARIAAQMPIEAKRKLADYVIDNSGSIEATRAAVAELWRRITASG